MSTATFHAFYAAIAPWLALSLLFIGRNPHPSRMRLIVSLALAAVLLLVPIAGFGICRWFAFLEPNPSIILTALLPIALLTRCGCSPLFRSQEWRAAWIFGCIAALILYPMGLGLTAIDPYTWGWGPSIPVATALISTLLLLKHNRFGIVLMFALLGMMLHPMESRNAWDHLIDPFYAIMSLLITLFSLGKRLLKVAPKERSEI